IVVCEDPEGQPLGESVVRAGPVFFRSGLLGTELLKTGPLQNDTLPGSSLNVDEILRELFLLRGSKTGRCHAKGHRDKYLGHDSIRPATKGRVVFRATAVACSSGPPSVARAPGRLPCTL